MSENILNIAICDDEPSARLSLGCLIEEYMKTNSIAFKTDEYSSGEELIKNGYSRYELIFLDIFMDNLNGIETAKRITAGSENAHIVFCTSSNEFAAQSYDVCAFHYLLKPIDKKALFAVLERFVRMYYKIQSITVKVGRDSESILLTDIIYAEAQGKKTIIHTKNGITKASMLLSEFEEMLPKGSFCKPIRYAVAAMDEIIRVPSDCLMLADGSKIQISRSRREEIKEQFTQYKIDNARRGFLK